MTPDATTLRVLYDPVGWADPQWIELFSIDPRWPRRVGNALFMQRAKISPVTTEDLNAQGVCWFLPNWDILPQVVYLVGARLVRGVLLKGDALLRLRHHAEGFLSLPLSELLWAPSANIADSNKWRHESLHTGILAAGMSCLRKSWPDLPQGWLDRVRMRLPPEAHRCAEGDKSKALLPASASCRRLFMYAVVFHHAQGN